MTTLKVSIIIPTYNRAGPLREALAGIARQTMTDYEVIVVDDGSTDETPAFLEELSRTMPTLRPLRQPNRGVAAARNAGVAHARGDYVAFCDSDDLWMPARLSRQLAYFEQHPDTGLVYSDVRLTRRGQTLVPSYFTERAPAAGWVFEELLLRNFIPTSSVLVKTRCLTMAGAFNESLPTSEDYELWLRCAQLFPIGYVAEVLVENRIFGDNLMQDAQHYAHRLSVLQSVIARGGEAVPPALARQAYARTYLSMGYELLRARQFAPARTALLRGWCHQPTLWPLYRYLPTVLLPDALLSAWLDRRTTNAKAGA